MYSCDSEVPFEETGLKKVPTGDWFCASCVTKNAGKSKGKVAAAPAASSKRKAESTVTEPKGKRGKAAAAQEVVEEEEEEVEVALLCDG